MRKNYTLKAIALAGTCLLPLTAFAADDDFSIDAAPVQKEAPVPTYNNQVTVGVKSQSETSALAGKYNASPYSGVSAIGGFELGRRDAWDSGGTTYFRFEGDGLSFNSHQFMPGSTMSLQYGQQGSWGAEVHQDSISFTQSTNFHSLNNSDGSLKWAARPPTAVGAGTVASPTTANLPAYYALLNTVNSGSTVGVQRDQVGGSVKWAPIENWSFNSGIDHEHKSGTVENSFVTANKKYIDYFPMPVDYDTDRYKASAQYNTTRLQGDLSYVFSNFQDNLASFNTANPFGLNSTNDAGNIAANYTGSIYSLPPSNDSHQFKGQLAYAITPTTRLTANGSYQLMEQNQNTTLAYSGAPANPGLPGSANAKIEDFFGNVGLSTRPFDKTDVHVSYTVDDRRNETQRYLATTMYTNDGSSHDTPVMNLPVSSLKQTAKADIGYRFTNDTKVSMNYAFSDKQQDYSVSDHTRENTVGAKLNENFNNWLHGTFSTAYSNRVAAAYNANAAWASADALSSATNPNGLGMYYDASRIREEARGMISADIAEGTSIGLNGKVTADHYPSSYYGITQDHTASIGPDVTFVPIKDVTAHLFYNYEEIFTGSKYTTSNTNGTVGANRVDWSMGNSDWIQTLGASAEWKATDKLKVTFSNDLSYGVTGFEEGAVWYGTSTNTGTNALQSLPNQKTLMNTLMVRSDYKLEDNIDLLFGYSWARSMATDYLYNQDSASINSSGNLAASLGGDGNPSYSVHTVTAAVKVSW